mmetsp:Transcript_34542/g.106699  ORF Transcript_34542/g.106699 Transcript_34542/m.106699 type:complete len:254 (-) Transcript_34542:4800-5561(-)
MMRIAPLKKSVRNTTTKMRVAMIDHASAVRRLRYETVGPMAHSSAPMKTSACTMLVSMSTSMTPATRRITSTSARNRKLLEMRIVTHDSSDDTPVRWYMPLAACSRVVSRANICDCAACRYSRYASHMCISCSLERPSSNASAIISIGPSVHPSMRNTPRSERMWLSIVRPLMSVSVGEQVTASWMHRNASPAVTAMKMEPSRDARCVNVRRHASLAMKASPCAPRVEILLTLSMMRSQRFSASLCLLSGVSS